MHYRKNIQRRNFIKNTVFAGAGVLIGPSFVKSAFQKPLAVPSSNELIIDSHCHAWNYWPYSPAVPDPLSRGTVEQLIHQMDIHHVQQATIVSAEIEHNPDNNEYVASAISKYPGRLHQFADIDSVWSATHHQSGAAKRMEKMISTFHPKGFTHYLSEKDDASWLNTRDGIDFLSLANEAGMIFSVACYPRQQAVLRKIAERFPKMPILCHHMSGLKCYGDDAVKNVEEVLLSASYPNIYLKFSGFAYVSANDKKYEYPYADTLWVYKACYEKFAGRMVWGSDFPVVNFYMTYQQSLEVLRNHCDFINKNDKQLILGKTLENLLSGQSHV